MRSITRRTRSIVAVVTISGRLSTRETLTWETPAILATSFSVTTPVERLEPLALLGELGDCSDRFSLSLSDKRMEVMANLLKK